MEGDDDQNGAEGLGNAGGPDQGDPDDANEDDEPQSRAAFNLLRSSYDSDAQFVHELYTQPNLQQKIRLICYDLHDLHLEYSHGLRMSTQEETMRACARRAAYDWFKTIQAMLRRLTSSALVEELNMFPRAMQGQPMSTEDPAVAADIELVGLHFNFIVDLCANRCWSQVMYGLCFPYLIATVYCETAQKRLRGAALMTGVCKAILALEEFVNNNPMHASACALLESIATNKWQVTREIFVMGANSGWTWDSDDIRATAWAMFSSPMTTKSTLESAFNHLRDKGHRHSRNEKMASETRYSYVATQPYARDEGGVQQVKTSVEDFSYMGRETSARSEIYALKPFNPMSTKMPTTYPHPQDIAAKWRPAGFYANKVSAAAITLAVKTAPRHFAGIGNAWTGCRDRVWVCLLQLVCRVNRARKDHSWPG